MHYFNSLLHNCNYDTSQTQHKAFILRPIALESSIFTLAESSKVAMMIVYMIVSTHQTEMYEAVYQVLLIRLVQSYHNT